MRLSDTEIISIATNPKLTVHRYYIENENKEKKQTFVEKRPLYIQYRLYY